MTRRKGKKSDSCRAPANDVEPQACLAALGQVNTVFLYGQMSAHSSHLTQLGEGSPSSPWKAGEWVTDDSGDGGHQAMPADSFTLQGCDASVLQKGHGNIGGGEGSRKSQKKTNEWEITHF